MEALREARCPRLRPGFRRPTGINGNSRRSAVALAARASSTTGWRLRRAAEPARAVRRKQSGGRRRRAILDRPVQVECVFGVRFRTRAGARQALFEYIAANYHTKRRHSSLGQPVAGSIEAALAGCHVTNQRGRATRAVISAASSPAGRFPARRPSDRTGNRPRMTLLTSWRPLDGHRSGLAHRSAIRRSRAGEATA